MRALKLSCCALAIAAFAALPARADEWNKQTILTFSGPVQVPGATLPAGTYQFKLADLQSNRHVVQVFDKDGMKLYTTILAIPDQRLKPTDKPVVMFSETAAGTPAAVKAWFYPGDTIGNEFVYPREEAVRIAKATHQPVLARGDDSNDMKTTEVARVDENGNTVTGENAKAKDNDAEMKSAENAKANERVNADQNKAAASTTATTTGTTAGTTAGTTGTTVGTTAGTTGTTASQQSATRTTTDHAARRSAHANHAAGTTGQANADQRANDQTQSAPRRGRLPKTASPLALYELVSGIALAGAYGVRRLRQSL